MLAQIPALGTCLWRTQMVEPATNSLPSLREETQQVAEHLNTAHREGHAWGDRAIFCRHWNEMDLCSDVLRAGVGVYAVASASATR